MTSTVKDGRVGFNQVVMEQDDEQPTAVLLIAWDQDEGVNLWLRAQSDVEQHSSPQHGGYSRAVAQFSLSDPPAWLGAGAFFPKETFSGWDDISDLATHQKRAAILRHLAEVVRFD